MSAQVFKEDKYLKEAADCGEVIWQRGLLRKGYGICHGTAGNAYAFLSLYKLTQDKKHLYRACKVTPPSRTHPPVQWIGVFRTMKGFPAESSVQRGFAVTCGWMGGCGLRTAAFARSSVRPPQPSPPGAAFPCSSGRRMKVSQRLCFCLQFAEWCLDYGTHGCRIPDRPYSLFEGMPFFPPMDVACRYSLWSTPELMELPAPPSSRDLDSVGQSRSRSSGTWSQISVLVSNGHVPLSESGRGRVTFDLLLHL